VRLIDPEISPDGKAIVVVVGRANLDEDRTDNAYQAGIWNDAGQGPGEDVMAGLAALEMRGIVDESNIAVSGWSYGGFMTSWLLGHSSIWKASVDGAAANSWLDMYNLSDRNVTTAEGFGGSPYTSPERMKAYLDRSPISYVQNVRTPTLVMCDVGDYRAPITQSCVAGSSGSAATCPRTRERTPLRRHTRKLPSRNSRCQSIHEMGSRIALVFLH
jgi:hypothetical protein